VSVRGSYLWLESAEKQTSHLAWIEALAKMPRTAGPSGIPSLPAHRRGGSTLLCLVVATASAQEGPARAVPGPSRKYVCAFHEVGL